MNKNK